MDSEAGAARDYATEIANARSAARLLRRGAFATAAVGIVTCVVAVISFVRGEAGLDASVEYFWAVGAVTVISGVAFYATSWNLALSASRLEAQLTASLPNTNTNSNH
ncbi:MAG: hypothetical protein Q8L05_03730 [Actinomycetota bacterium]|nr:hypothetical protein [Actinomycetota bacterium]MDP2287611.1 hypothetical protein [Actinomycetota bacterium]